MEDVIGLNGTKIGAYPSHHLNDDDMCGLPNDEKYTHIDEVLLVVVLMNICCVSFPIPEISGKIKG